MLVFIVVNHVGLIGERYIFSDYIDISNNTFINILGLTPYSYTSTSHLS